MLEGMHNVLTVFYLHTPHEIVPTYPLQFGKHARTEIPDFELDLKFAPVAAGHRKWIVVPRQ